MRGIKVDMKKDSLFEVPVGVSSFGNPCVSSRDEILLVSRELGERFKATSNNDLALKAFGVDSLSHGNVTDKFSSSAWLLGSYEITC